MGQLGAAVIMLDIVRGQSPYLQRKAVPTELAARWRPTAVLIENKVSGQSLIRSVQQETGPT
jgi:hypothetical protein